MSICRGCGCGLFMGSMHSWSLCLLHGIAVSSVHCMSGLIGVSVLCMMACCCVQHRCAVALRHCTLLILTRRVSSRTWNIRWQIALSWAPRQTTTKPEGRRRAVHCAGSSARTRPARKYFRFIRLDSTSLSTTPYTSMRSVGLFQCHPI